MKKPKKRLPETYPPNKEYVTWKQLMELGETLDDDEWDEFRNQGNTNWENVSWDDIREVERLRKERYLDEL